MTCTIIAHTRFEDAVDLLAQDLARNQASDPLAAHTLLVHGQVIGRWLTTELALRSEHGIAAGLDLRPVGAFCRSLVAPPGGPDPYGVEALIWSIDAALADQAWLAGSPQCDGLCQATARLDRAGRHALAVHLAGILDRYQFERPDWIAAWSAGKPVAEAASVPWLPLLWARLRERAGALPPLSSRLEALTRALTDGQPPPAGCPQALWLIAPSALPPLLVRLLTALGDHGGVALRILHLMPATEKSLWTALDNEREDYDPETTPMGGRLAGSHPLLAAWARQAHDLAVLLADLGEGRTRTVDFDAILPRTLPDDASLLAQLQAQIWDARSGPLIWRGPLDRSLTVHRAHSPLREAEVLRDALVDALARPHAPRPDEVLVAVTDLETYAALLVAVLGEDRGDGIRFPVRIVGQPAAVDPLITALLAILELPGRAASLEEVLSPCDAPALRRRFGLDEQDLALLRHRLEDAGISWGLDALQRARSSAYRSDEGSWRAGVDRLLLGLLTGPQEVVVPGRWPAGARLLGDDDAIGGIAVYLDLLVRFAEAVGDGTRTMPVASWRALLFTLLADLVAADRGPELHALSLMRGAIAAIPREAADPDLRTIRKHLGRMLMEDQLASAWSRGGITVAPLSALRHAPHAVIAVLGLDSSFPRLVTTSAFDVAATRRRRGDLSVRLDARQLVLDLLLAARQRVHLSWTGWATLDGSPREASSVIDDLLRVLDAEVQHQAPLARGRDAVLVEHRLHASATAYFDGTGTLPRSHDALACAAALARRARDAGEQQPGVRPFITGASRAQVPQDLRPSDLQLWLGDPARAFCESVLALRFARDDALADHEPIELAGLDSWRLRDTVLAGLLAGEVPAEAKLRQDGALPHGPAGANLLMAITADAVTLKARLDAALGGEEPQRAELLASSWRVDVALPGGGAPQRVIGSITRCDGHRALALHSGALSGRHLLAGWVLHQLVNAQARQAGTAPLTTVIIGLDRGSGLARQLHGCCTLAVEAADERQWAGIADALRAAWQRPQPHFPDLAANCWDVHGDGINADLLASHLAAWRSGAYDAGESTLRSELAAPRAWTRLLWRGIDNPTAAWHGFIERLWRPVVHAVLGRSGSPA